MSIARRNRKKYLAIETSPLLETKVSKWYEQTEPKDWYEKKAKKIWNELNKRNPQVSLRLLEDITMMSDLEVQNREEFARIAKNADDVIGEMDRHAEEYPSDSLANIAYWLRLLTYVDMKLEKLHIEVEQSTHRQMLAM